MNQKAIRLKELIDDAQHFIDNPPNSLVGEIVDVSHLKQLILEAKIRLKQIEEEEKDNKLDLSVINEFSSACYNLNKSKGFWDKERNIGEIYMMIVSELAEGFESYRTELVNKPIEQMIEEGYEVKDSIVDEFADAIIRILDICGRYNIDIARQLKWKYQYNMTRPYKHGKAF